jgi:hypothetical protein
MSENEFTKDITKVGKTESELKLLVNEEVNNLKKTIKQKETILENYKAEHGVLESFFRDLKEHVEAINPVPVLYKPRAGRVMVDSPCSVVVQVCDAHMGAVQRASEIEGFGEFDPEICRNRQLSFIKKVIEWVDVHRTAYTVDECVVLVLGDLISGDIHDELRVTNAFPVPVQIVEASTVLSEQILMLSQHFPKIRVEFLVEDNHSRLTKKPQAKEAGINSYNYVIGFIAKERASRLSNVTFNIYPQYEASVQVSGQRYLLCHGHGIMGWSGFPYYGIERKVSREALKRMNGPDCNKFHKVIMGHWHAPLAHPFYWIGGSVSGTDAYDHKNGRHARPSQAAWFCHPKHSEFDRTDFWL